MTAVAIRVFDSEGGTTTEYAYTASPVRIGRNPLNDLTLPFPFVSGWHAVVRFDASGAKFFDLGSTNGTLHNGRRVQAGEPIPIAGGVSLTIGKLELRIQQSAAADRRRLHRSRHRRGVVDRRGGVGRWAVHHWRWRDGRRRDRRDRSHTRSRALLNP